MQANGLHLKSLGCFRMAIFSDIEADKLAKQDLSVTSPV